MKLFCCLIVSLFLSANSFAEPGPRDQYAQKFRDQIEGMLYSRLLEQLKQEGVPDLDAKKITKSFLDGMVSCHMLAMDMHSESISWVAYETVVGGGSYADAKMAFETALGNAMADENEEIVSKFIAATQEAQQCAQRVKQETSL